uniref:Reverse transcriptase domain-containing protein n=1 Tax=Tanacetum cinerariifolium TaxID=118510 RepID=A0A6L2MMN7_TANCI|nr:hypothetical protein [Tanacetum cinerariifolium]
MPPKKTTTPMTDAAIKESIAQGVADALAGYEANRSSGNGDDSHHLGSSRRRTEHTTRYYNAAYGMTWKILMKMMTGKYFPRCEIKNMVIEIWNLKVKDADVVSHTQRFQDSALMCGRMFLEESDQAENKRILNNNSSNNNIQKPPFKRQNVAKPYSARPNEKKEYAGTVPLCNKCKLHHNGPCTVKYENCNMVGHLTRDYMSPAAANNQRTLTCYEYGNQGHYKSDYPELKNRNHGNKIRGTVARGIVYALG